MLHSYDCISLFVSFVDIPVKVHSVDRRFGVLLSEERLG
jgi:hypothetical protein